MVDFIQKLTPALEERIQRNHSLNIDTFIIPSPYIKDEQLEKDYEHSYVWEEEGEILGYLLVYSNPERTRFHLYKQVTSPFGRGKGIGSAFIRRLASEVRSDAFLYLYIWEKQQEAVLFFAKKGFTVLDRIVYRGLVFIHMVCRASDLRDAEGVDEATSSFAEELGKTRHDARKTIRLLSDMVDRLSIDTCHKIIEDINRETTALINMLNAYRDSVERYHEVNIKTLLLERILPFIELSPVPCDVHLIVKGRIPEAYGPYLDFGRALINLASNALDAIKEAGRRGKITIELKEEKDHILLTFSDNGVGIEPERLVLREDGLPMFVGRTTKIRPTATTSATSGSPTDDTGRSYGFLADLEASAQRQPSQGQGIGTRQIFAVFGRENIRVESRVGKGTRWKIRLPKKPTGDSSFLQEYELRYREFTELTEQIDRETVPSRSVLGSFIWRLRKKEVFLWDLILHFSRYHNIREIFRTFLSFQQGYMMEEGLREYVDSLRTDHPEFRDWLVAIAVRVRDDQEYLELHAPQAEYGGILFKSYGQATDRTVIFTMDPATGRFMATDRKLAEHLDFAPYLKKSREELLRGEFSGDVSDPKRPLMLGVWSILGDEDAVRKVALVREGARTLIRMGLKKEKRLGFYASTFVQGSKDLNTYITLTLGELADTQDSELERCLVCVEEEWLGGLSSD
ncbi:MAG: GNAT family N-acetyltransferase [Spirochaetes bacterium]|nr:GNAT family N-acetyltransferase [Spirochaetota bacterium]